MPTRLRKMRRMRGSRTMGYGQIGQHRHSGKQGGHGNAGLHKHKWSWLLQNDPDHFRRDPFKVPGSEKISKWANVGDLELLISSATKSGNGEKRKGKDDAPVSIDLSSMGVEKLLGTGAVGRAFLITVDAYTERAKTKVESAGGKILVGS